MDALGIHDFGLFVVAGLLLNITPGVDFLYVLTRGVTRGVRAGVWASLGIGLGCCVHIAAAALGLSAILATSAAAFTAVKWIGAAYLVYLGISMLRQRRGLRELQLAQPVQDSMTRIFWQGFLTNVLNPKVALFFLAFLPQFIDPASSTKVAAFLTLGTAFNTTGTLWNIFVAWAAAFVAARLQAASRFGLWLNRGLGSLFIALGVRLAATQRG
jgi:threonine/homoserine/homoserine lactone efflux protein